jgi:hypothetical protein
MRQTREPALGSAPRPTRKRILEAKRKFLRPLNTLENAS